MDDRAALEIEGIEITPKMVEAGLSELLQFSREADIYEDRVRSIFTAMMAAREEK